MLPTSIRTEHGEHYKGGKQVFGMPAINHHKPVGWAILLSLFFWSMPLSQVKLANPSWLTIMQNCWVMGLGSQKWAQLVVIRFHLFHEVLAKKKKLHKKKSCWINPRITITTLPLRNPLVLPMLYRAPPLQGACFCLELPRQGGKSWPWWLRGWITSPQKCFEGSP